MDKSENELSKYDLEIRLCAHVVVEDPSTALISILSKHLKNKFAKKVVPGVLVSVRLRLFEIGLAP